MESISNGIEDMLIEGLSFKLSPGSSYVSDRRKSTYWASGSNVYGPTGTRVVRFLLNGEDGTWVDPTTIRIQYDLVNKDTTGASRVRPLTGAHIFFRRGRLSCNNALVEDLNEYNRCHELLDSLKPDAVRDNIDIESFGARWDDQFNRSAHAWSSDTMPGIAANKKQTVSFKPCFGLFNQSKLLPLKYAPLIIEMEIVNNADDPVITTTSSDDPSFQGTTSSNWSIENICVKCDCLTLDASLSNEYTKHLLDSKALPIKYSTYINQQSTISSSGSTSVQVARAVSRLQKCFVTFFTQGDSTKLENKAAIKFYHPMGGLQYNNALKLYNNDKELEIQLQLGPKLYPEYPCKSLAESFSLLKQTLNLPDSGHSLHSIGIDNKQYMSNKFIFGMSFEKVPESSWTGTSTKSGQILIVKVTPSVAGDTVAQQMYVTLVSEQILEIRDTGVSVYD